jgi:hypothetical protein
MMEWGGVVPSKAEIQAGKYVNKFLKNLLPDGED